MKDFDFMYNVTNSVYNKLQFSTLRFYFYGLFMLKKYEKWPKTVCLIDVEDAYHDNDLYITNIVFQYYK